MKILLCPDSFKDSLSAIEVSDAIAKGIHKFNKEYCVKKLPLADGGEGSLAVLINNEEGKYFTVSVKDPLFREIRGTYGIIDETAIIEMAKVAGLDLLEEKERNPMLTTTYGVGDLIRHALDQGIRKFIIAIGGSATNDCGIGVANALGVEFLDATGKPIKPTGGALGRLHRINYDNIDQRILDSEVKVLCDVSNPLYGKDGAAYVYAKQKGADEKNIKALDENLKHFSEIIKKTFNKDISKVPGAGAAGGLGAGLMVFLKGELVSGFNTISNLLSLEEYIRTSDLVITGEGRIDSQSLNGKVVIEVSKIAKKYNKPVVSIVGSYDGNLQTFHEHGITSVFSIIQQPMNLTKALEKARSKRALSQLSEEVIRLFDLSSKF